MGNYEAFGENNKETGLAKANYIEKWKNSKVLFLVANGLFSDLEQGRGARRQHFPCHVQGGTR